MDCFKREGDRRMGPGGWKCICCGPPPKYRKRFRRAVRRNLKLRLREESDG
jgi:hypothetical protein